MKNNKVKICPFCKSHGATAPAVNNCADCAALNQPPAEPKAAAKHTPEYERILSELGTDEHHGIKYNIGKKTESAKHTPGPWELERGQNGHMTLCEPEGLGGAVIADIWATTNNDAALIAAAPELLAALEAARLWAVEYYGSLPWLESAEAAIAKAKGE